MSSSGPSISQVALMNFRYFRLVKHWGKQVLHLIYRKSFLDGQSKPICEILIDNGISLRQTFISEERANLIDKPSEELDITILNKLCLCLWEKGVKDPGDKLRSMVRRIKEERNYVCCEETDISLMDLATKINVFQKELEETLRETVSYFKDHSIDTLEIDKLHTDIKDDLPKTLEKIREKFDPYSKDDIQKLQQEMLQYWDELSEFIIERSQKELKSNEILCRIRPFDCLAHYGVTDPSIFNVDLKMDQQKEFQGGFKGSELTFVKERDLLITDHDGKDPEAVIVSGDAGSGKTTMLSSIVEKWLKDSGEMADLTSFHLLLYMQFRHHSHRHFDEYLAKLLPTATAQFGLEHVKASILKSKCLILCDGFDESNEKSLNLFKEMLSLNFERKKILITTRPERKTIRTTTHPTSTIALNSIVDDAHLQRINVSILGLKFEDMQKLINKITHVLEKDETKRKKDREELIQAINGMDESMIVSLKTPLYFNLYIFLCINFPGSWKDITSVTTFHIQLKKHMFQRIIEKTELCEEILYDFDKLFMEWSLPYFLNEKYEFSDSDLWKLKSMIKNRIESKMVSPEGLKHFDDIMSSYFHVEHKSDIDTTKVFCYKHRHDQEFSVANFICGKIIDSVQKKEKNVFASALSSVGILLGEEDEEEEDEEEEEEEEENKVDISRALDFIPFIVGILYSSKEDPIYKDALYEVISDIHKYILRLVKDLMPRESLHIDKVLIPLSETGSDETVLTSLVASLESLPEKSEYVIWEEKSLRPLKLLLPRLSPVHVREIRFRLYRSTAISLLALMETISANNHRIPVHLILDLNLQGLCESTDQTLDTTDPALHVKNLYIEIDHYEDINPRTLHPLPFTSDELEIRLYTKRKIREIPQILNIIFSRRRTTNATKEKENSKFSLLSSGRSGMLVRRRCKELVIAYRGTNIITDDDLRFVVESLDIGPLTEIRIRSMEKRFKGIKDEESLRELCKRRGLGNLVL